MALTLFPAIQPYFWNMFNHCINLIFSSPVFVFLSTYSVNSYVDVQQETKDNIVVMELFTSEGCSSCPPADKLLSEYSKQAKAGEGNIICLSFHVHYWDRLGWSDPYSNQKYSDRQRTYGKKLNVRKVFTPQMIVNGTVSFVGSNKEEADKAILNARAEPMSTSVSISEVVMEENYCQFKYRLSQSSRNTVINFALTEDGLSQQVLRGENRGKLLKHDNVVRAFKTQEKPQKSGEVSLRIPEGADVSKLNIVVYVQQNEDLKIIGAGSSRVN